MKRTTRAATLVVALLVATMAMVATASAGQDKFTICHADGQDGTLKFSELTIAEEAIYKENGGHFNEDGTPQAGHEDDYFGACRPPVTTTVPEVTTTVPEVTTTVPEVTTTLPEVTTTVPEVTTTAPEVTTTIPEVTTTVPEVTTTVPEVTTTVPEVTTTVPEVTTTLPECTGDYETDPSGCPIDDCNLPGGKPAECDPTTTVPPLEPPVTVERHPDTGANTMDLTILGLGLVVVGTLVTADARNRKRR